jgi:hypothetical protein
VALNKNDPAFDEGLDALVPASGTPTLGEALASIANNRVTAARTLAAYFEAGGSPGAVIEAWPDIIVSRAGPDAHHYKFHLALLEETEAALPEWQPTLLLGITIARPLTAR